MRKVIKYSKELVAEYGKTLTKLGKNQSILVVEDDKAANAMLYQFLSKFYSDVKCAYDGQEALELYKHNSFDIVLTDISMPNMTGLELSDKIRQISTSQKIIIMTAHKDQEYMLEALRHNVNDYISKPLDFNELMSVLCRISKQIENEYLHHKYNAQDDIKTNSSKILIIDDSELALSNLSDILHKTLDRPTILEAENGKDGIEKLKNNHNIQLIFVDWNMPIMDGIEFIKYVRASSVYKNIKIIMVSTQNEREKVSEVVKLGVSGYLVKPYTPEAVSKLTKRLMDV